MKNKKTAIMNEISNYVSELGFVEVSSNSDDVIYELPNGIRLICSLERYGDEFTVSIAPPAWEASHSAMAAYVLLEGLAPKQAVAATAVLRINEKTEDRVYRWWRIFIDFLSKEGSDSLQWPWSDALIEKYRHAAEKRMSTLGLISDSSDCTSQMSGTGYVGSSPMGSD